MSKRRAVFYLLLVVVLGGLMLVGCQGPDTPDVETLEVPEDAVARVVFFRADDCEFCAEVEMEIIAPLQERCGANLEVKMVDIETTEGYEAFVATETALVGDAGRWDLPVVVVDEMAYVGEAAIREGVLPYLKCVFGSGGNAWPAVPALEAIAAEPQLVGGDSPFGSLSDGGVEACVDDEEAALCASPQPIFALYLTREACDDTCERTQYDLTYLKGFLPQLSFETRSMEENRALADALAERLGVPEAQWGRSPVVVVGEDYLVGDDLDLEVLRDRIASYTETGATALWYALELP